MLVFLAIGNAKVLSFALGDAKVPNANDFALQWNIGFIYTCEGFKWRRHLLVLKQGVEFSLSTLTVYFMTFNTLKFWTSLPTAGEVI